jgi:hypothetical protein
LNPYTLNKPLFKLEKENFVNEKLTDLWFYGISSKRYVLYNYEDGKIKIRKHSSHGLGHIENPFTAVSGWEEKFWMDILELHYKRISLEEINEKYSDLYAISSFSVTTPILMGRFAKLNKRKPYTKKIKPFNFCLAGSGNYENIKPLAPFRKNSQETVYDEFIDYNTGKVMQGVQYWKDMSQFFWDYVNHPESKFNGETGVLERKHLKVTGINYIGKESNDLDEVEVLGVGDDSYIHYQNHTIPLQKILKKTPKQTRDIFSKNQLYRIKKKIRSGKFNFSRRTLSKLSKI